MNCLFSLLPSEAGVLPRTPGFLPGDLATCVLVCVPNKLLETRDYTSLIRVSLLGPGVRSKSSPPTKIGGASKTAEAERGLAEGTVQRTEPEEDL